MSKTLRVYELVGWESTWGGGTTWSEGLFMTMEAAQKVLDNIKPDPAVRYHIKSRMVRQ